MREGESGRLGVREERIFGWAMRSKKICDLCKGRQLGSIKTQM